VTHAVAGMLSLLLLSACGSESAATDVASEAGPPTLPTTISDGEVFAPPPAEATPRLTAAQAWAKFAERVQSTVTEIPTTFDAQLGVLQSYLADDRLAYGYNQKELMGCVGSHPSPASDQPCRRYWIFLDADTGRHIEETEQTLQSP
jgi:hypothetical protein